MQRFVVLLKFTESGLSHIKNSPARASTFKTAALKCGVTIEAQYWLLGEFDGIVILNAPDEKAATAAALQLGALGFVRTQVCRAFDEAEMHAIAAKL